MGQVKFTPKNKGEKEEGREGGGERCFSHIEASFIILLQGRGHNKFCCPPSPPGRSQKRYNRPVFSGSQKPNFSWQGYDLLNFKAIY